MPLKRDGGYDSSHKSPRTHHHTIVDIEEYANVRISVHGTAGTVDAPSFIFPELKGPLHRSINTSGRILSDFQKDPPGFSSVFRLADGDAPGFVHTDTTIVYKEQSQLTTLLRRRPHGEPSPHAVPPSMSLGDAAVSGKDGHLGDVRSEATMATNSRFWREKLPARRGILGSHTATIPETSRLFFRYKASRPLEDSSRKMEASWRCALRSSQEDDPPLPRIFFRNKALRPLEDSSSRDSIGDATLIRTAAVVLRKMEETTSPHESFGVRCRFFSRHRAKAKEPPSTSVLLGDW